MKKAFTMVELIFVIVIIGILASVAIPKLAATRDDAVASVCVTEVGQLLQEVASVYAKAGNITFKSMKVSDMTNIQIRSAGESRGIKNDTIVDTIGITYVCDNEDIVTIIGENSGMEYNLTITVTTGTEMSPAALISVEEIIKNVLGGSSPKVFVF